MESRSGEDSIHHSSTGGGVIPAASCGLWAISPLFNSVSVQWVITTTLSYTIRMGEFIQPNCDIVWHILRRKYLFKHYLLSSRITFLLNSSIPVHTHYLLTPHFRYLSTCCDNICTSKCTQKRIRILGLIDGITPLSHLFMPSIAKHQVIIFVLWS